MGDGEATDKTLTLSKSNNWKGQWEGLEVYKDGEIIEYSVVEDKVDKYTATYAGDVEAGFVVTNHHMSKDSGTPDNPDVPNTGDMSRLGAWFAFLYRIDVGQNAAVLNEKIER